MSRIRRWLCIVMLLSLLVPAIVTTASAQVSTVPHIQQLISYYYHYGENASGEIEDVLMRMEAIDPQQAAVWEKIMDNWSWYNIQMTVNPDLLPEGLPEDESLCIVVLGYGLNPDGSMKRELANRLKTALACAEQYPNAYVLCTGGKTSSVPGISEAGEMGKWLLKAGLEKDRLILEMESLSTTENALNSYDLLTESYPQVESIAIVTSDYHIRRGCVMFSTVSSYKSGLEGGKTLSIVGNAVCKTKGADRNTMDYQARGIASIAGVDFDPETEPAVYLAEEMEEVRRNKEKE